MMLLLFVLDFTVNDKVSVRFFYNLGIEYFKYLQLTLGHNAVMAMIDGDCVTSGYEHSPSVASDVDTESQQQVINDFQQLNLDTNEIETQSPSKVNFSLTGARMTNASFSLILKP